MSELLLFRDEEEEVQFNTNNTILSNKNYYELENELIESKKYISLLEQRVKEMKKKEKSERKEREREQKERERERELELEIELEQKKLERELELEQKELELERKELERELERKERSQKCQQEEAKVDANLIKTHHNLIENIKYYQKLFESKYNTAQNGCHLFGNSHNYRNPTLKYSVSLFPISKKYGLTFQYIAPCQTQGDVIDYVRHRKNSAASSNSGIVKHQAVDSSWEYFLFPHNVTDTEIEHEIKLLSYVLDEYVKAFSVIDIKERLEKLCGENMDLMKLNISYGDRTKSLFD